MRTLAMDLVTFPVTTAAVTAPARPASAADPAPVAASRQAEPPDTNLRPRPLEPAFRDASRVEEAGKPRALKPYGVIILPDREPKPKDEAGKPGKDGEPSAPERPTSIAERPPATDAPPDAIETAVGAPEDRPPDLAS